MKKLIEVEFITHIHYPDWLANVVPVSGGNGGNRVCIDFGDSNKLVGTLGLYKIFSLKSLNGRKGGGKKLWIEKSMCRCLTTNPD
jgi:hypothetical protein